MISSWWLFFLELIYKRKKKKQVLQLCQYKQVVSSVTVSCVFCHIRDLLSCAGRDLVCRWLLNPGLSWLIALISCLLTVSLNFCNIKNQHCNCLCPNCEAGGMAGGNSASSSQAARLPGVLYEAWTQHMPCGSTGSWQLSAIGADCRLDSQRKG